MAGIDKQWIGHVGDVDVERLTGVKRSFVTSDLGKRPVGVLHTTEGGWAGSLSVFVNSTGTPTFMAGFDTSVGKDRVGQCMPIGEMALTLENATGGVETNRWARVQIECLGFTQFPSRPKWFLGVDHKALRESTKNMLADLVYEASKAANIPLRHAGKGNDNRDVATWSAVGGWYAHSEVPENHHRDVGVFDWDDLFARGQRWDFRLVDKTGVVDKSSPVRGNVVTREYAKFVSRKSLKFARLAAAGKRPRFVRNRIR